MRRDSRFRKGIPSIFLLFLVSVSVLTPLGGLVRPAEATSSTTMQQYTFQTPGSFFNGQPGPNIIVPYHFHPTGEVNWFNSLGGNITMTSPLATAVVQFNSTAYVYVATGQISGAVVTARTYFFKQAGTSGPSPNMEMVITGTSSAAVNYTLTFTNVSGVPVTQPDSCTMMLGTVGFSWCDVKGTPVYFDPIALTLKFTLPRGAFTIDPVTVGTSSSFIATSDDPERKVFFCQGQYWAFYNDGTNFVYRTSTDGSSWTVTTTVRGGSSFGFFFSTWVDCANTKVYYAFAAATTNFQHRAGTLNTNGTISWDYNEVSITGTNPQEESPTITKDSAGVLWIAFMSYVSGGGKGNRLEIWKCTISGTSCGTASNWGNSLNFQLDSSNSEPNATPVILALTAGKMSVVYSHPSTSAIGIRTYTGSTWNTEVSATSNYLPQDISALAISDTTYFVGSTTSNVMKYWSCAYPCSSTPSETTLDNGPDNFAALSSDNSQELVAAYGNSGASTTIFYKRSTDAGVSWGTAQTLAAADIGQVSLNTQYTKGSNSKYDYLWTSTTSSPNTIYFQTLSFNAAYTGSLAESPTMSDAAGKLFQGLRSEEEPISGTLTDAIAKAAGKFLSEVPPISDVADRLFNGLRSLTESPTISDVAARVLTGARSISENFGVVPSDSVTKFFQGSRGMSESLVGSLSDSISKSAGKFLFETPTLLDATNRLLTGFRALTEAPTLSDALARIFTGFRGMSESLPGITDSISKSAGKFLSETQTLSDAVARVFTGFRSLTETPTVSDALSRIFTGFRSLTESPTVSDALARVFTGFGGLSESLSGISDAISKSAGKFIYETPAPSDVVSRIFTGFRGLVEIPTMADALARVFTGFRALTEAQTISDSVARLFAGFRGLTESPTISDAITRVFTSFRTLSETPPISDAASRVFAGFRGLTEDLTSTIADAVSRFNSYTASISESPTLSDSLARLFGGFRTITESPTLSDSVSRAFGGARDISENLASVISDLVGKGTTRLLSETLAPSDLATGVFNGFRTSSESPAISDAVARVFGGFRSFTESPTISDAASSAFAGFRGLSESLVSSITDSVSKGVGKFSLESLAPSDLVSRLSTGFRGLADSPTLSDTVSKAATTFRGLAEDLSTISDSISKSAGKFLSETPSLSDASSRLFTGFRVLAESPAISEVVSRVFTGFRALSETPALSDVVARVSTGFRSMSESVVGMTDSISKSAGKFLSETPSLSDAASRLFTGFRVLAESPAISDVVSRVFSGFRGMSESLAGITDSIIKSAGKFLSETPSLSDAASRLFTGFRVLAESPAISDVVSSVFTGFRATSEDISTAISDGVARVGTLARDLPEDLSAISDSIAGLFNGARGLTENPTISDTISRAATTFRGLSEDLSSISDSIRKSAGKFLSEDVSATLSDLVSRSHHITLNLADVVPPFSDSVSRFYQAMRDFLESFKFKGVMSTFASFTRRVTEKFPFSESVPFSHTFASSFQVLVTDSYAYIEAAAPTARNIIEKVAAVVDTFVFGDQIGSGEAGNPLSFFTDLGNRLVTGLSGLTGGSTVVSSTILAFMTIAALAGVTAIFARRKRGRSGCSVVTVAAPLCPRFGAQHKCRSQPGHPGAHQCRCGASW